MSGSASTSDGKQQIVTDIADVLRAMPSITVAEYTRGTLPADDTGTHDGMRKTYFHSLSLEKARMCFRISSKLVQTVRKNYTRK